jgi:hypothetical protein
MNDYTYWMTGLNGIILPFSEGDAHPGFYRRKVVSGKDSPWTPVAIWQDEYGEMQALQHATVVLGPRNVDPAEAFMWCAKNPITEDAYRAVAERGENWPSPYRNGKRLIS